MALANGGSVKNRVIRSGLWVGASEVLLALLGVFRSVVLARLLTPEIFGLMGLAQLAVKAFETFTRPGIAQALVARKRAFEEAQDTAFTLLVGRGVILALLLLVAAPWIAWFYEADELEPVLRTLSIVYLIAGFGSINTVARWRELEFRQLTYLSQATAWIATLATVVAAYLLRNVWALVLGQIVSAATTTLLSYHFAGGRVRFAFDREIARELFTYGKYVTGSAIVLFVAMELDSLIIGKYLGLEQLGFYALAFTISQLATSYLSKVVSGIMLPAYSKLQSDEKALRTAYLRTVSFVMFAVLPATAGLILVAEPLIQVVYGSQWLPSAAPLKVLAVFGLLLAFVALNGYLFQGIGNPSIAFRLGLLRLLVIAPLIPLMTKALGLRGAAIAVTLGIAIQLLASLYYLRKLIAIELSQIARSIWRPVWTTFLMGVVVVALMFVVDTTTLVGLAIVVACGVTTYSGLNLRYLSSLRAELSRSRSA